MRSALHEAFQQEKSSVAPTSPPLLLLLIVLLLHFLLPLAFVQAVFQHLEKAQRALIRL